MDWVDLHGEKAVWENVGEEGGGEMEVRVGSERGERGVRGERAGEGL